MSKFKEDIELLSKPGDVILETIEFIKMTQVELAERMGKTPSKINDIISGKEPITLSTAFLLEKVLGIDAQFWLNREVIYREKLSRYQQQEENKKYIKWAKEQPINDLKKLGYISKDASKAELSNECLKFYGVASPNQWNEIYKNTLSAPMYRKSGYHKSTISSLSALLRIGEIQMRKKIIKPFDKKLFKSNLIKIRELVRIHPEDLLIQVKDLCEEAGVHLIFSPNISEAPVNGIARWIGGSPLIQITDRFKTNDHFWFSFFHEAGHILLHGKKDIFIDGSDEDDGNHELREEEANNFASNFLLPVDIIKELDNYTEINDKTIRQLARLNKTHPAIIVGRLQHFKKVPYSFGNSFKLKVLFEEDMMK
ncbi:ImmA/IrrE family metallo-endopeptidase [Autumnicola musiva]|uniref:ImmA/IrrE family metallo-endopeptidase n=1 Tax=Autumnicola musiva TaxID=3075589 RepID=A0ABU3DB74_9FLAO|nr:ImmA/IrrE family metallo-endopeptidase [Zunongwangia sp. F117]MDT0678772.1 ImmA/IrrE family metallo-endopeptidase [Zunongwangia sp. F117]